jgi:polar amino acid transport system substrate-binding protein
MGFKDTYNLVMNKLEAPSALGYSCSGEVIDVGRNVTGFKTGDYVACGGSTAVHADVVAVPVNLCVKLPADVQLKHASFATIASIALQGIRQADLQVGEHTTVIGLGLIGQLTVKILEASGIRALGIDINPEQVNIAAQNLSAKVYDRNQAGLDQIILNETYGIGSDAVIITAGTSSLDPVNFAGEICRKKGKVIIVGAVPTGFERKNYYQKELDLRMSSSYGPGRYDTSYEEKGIDYPVGYVRWTENRNMQAFIDLLSAKKLEIDSLITHIYPLEKATEAYNMILQRSEPFTGILIQYDDEKSPLEKVVLNERPYISVDKINAGFIGAGSFAQICFCQT